jgi:hypothetical protein
MIMAKNGFKDLIFGKTTFQTKNTLRGLFSKFENKKLFCC